MTANEKRILFFEYESVIPTGLPEAVPTATPSLATILKELAKIHALYMISDQEDIAGSVEEFGLTKYFADIFEKERLGKIPKTDQWFYLTPIDELSLEKEKVTVIANSVEGISGAKQAGLPVIACTWGQEREALINAKPDFLADQPQELLSILAI